MQNALRVYRRLFSDFFQSSERGHEVISGAEDMSNTTPNRSERGLMLA